MDRIEQLVDDVIAAYQDRRVRLWLANFADLPDAFDEWGGVVRLSAEDHLGRWAPTREALLARVRGRLGDDGAAITFEDVSRELLPAAQDALVTSLAARQVPRRVAEQARHVLLAAPPPLQWKM
jgi:hypothetical protein